MTRQTALAAATMTTRTMTAEQAAWVRAVAWRNHHRRTHAETPAVHSMCACQNGPCGYCSQLGHHRHCTHEGKDRKPQESPATYLTDRGGGCLAGVYETGHRHVWSCACKTAGHGRTPIQDALF